MNKYETLEIIMDNIDRGIMFIDDDKKIQLCNAKAKEITGIVIDANIAHESGTIAEGDIVIIADNKLGDDDGELSAEELALLNIKDKDIKPGDMLLAVGVYKNDKIKAEYKYLREHQINIPLVLDVNYLGFKISASINTEAKETLIKVNEKEFHLKYLFSVGNVVVIDGKTGFVKFFQAKGYSIRHEDLGKLLRGGKYHGKSLEPRDVEVQGKDFLQLFSKSELSDKLFDILQGTSQDVKDELYEINKRLFVCTMIHTGQEKKGVFLLLQDIESLEKLLNERNDIIMRIEETNRKVRQSDIGYPEHAFGSIIGRSAKMNEVKYMAYKASQNKFNVIITGESGTGKSMIAREIHNLWDKTRPFVEVNCNAIAPSLFESELFGYVGGAFTGAKNEGKVGFFEAADGGTIFLDEIGEIPLDIQVKLLHVLQTKMIYRVGSSKPKKIDVRVIAATNKDLEAEVLQGNFRQDLFYRINVFPIVIPPLRERKSDLYLMINSIATRTCKAYGIKLKQFSGDALQQLLSYNWPGNVRELENAVERAITLCESDIIYSEHLNIGSRTTPKTMKELLGLEEKRILEMAMIRNVGNKQKVMKELELSKTVFYEKLKKYDIK